MKLAMTVSLETHSKNQQKAIFTIHLKYNFNLSMIMRVLLKIICKSPTRTAQAGLDDSRNAGPQQQLDLSTQVTDGEFPELVLSRMPRRVPELLIGIARQGCGMDAARCRRGRTPLSATPIKSEERRIKAASGSLFLWILSFGDAKESISVVGQRTDIKPVVAPATPRHVRQ